MNVGTPGFNGDRLAEARQARGLTGVALAEVIGVTPQSVSQYEKGKQTPRADVLEAISTRLNVPLSYFMRSSAVLDDAPIFWRCRATASSVARQRAEIRLRWVRDILGYLAGFLDFPGVDLPKLDVPRDFREIDTDYLESAATELRTQWGIGSGPMPDLLLEIENHGIVVSRINMGAEKQDGFSQLSRSGGIPFIVLGRDKASAVRQRFDAAHELAHILLHKNIENKRLNTAADNKILEDQAHRFANALLLPADQFVAELWAPTLDAMMALKDRWKVSVGAMIKRCEALELLDREQAQRLWINYNRRGWRKEEPLDGKIEKERPRLLRRSVELLLSEKVQSVSQVTDGVRLNPRDIEELCDLDPGLLSNELADAKAMPRLKGEEPSSAQVVGNVVQLFGRR
ncbi:MULTISPECIES: helix-turn-helix domain-containing protein [unclassified Methylobacterium]|jgi:Zn-dependent peptidase ImmA (M78 family)/transcriptional regulator with XRE-family HTH domain|uniref:helix-turn-helix domain-containing protein n=1 Tax=unclassified Methylobacterium TaxID=2615210 RepID=UPI0013541896|nr:XRE family transcriptional regulator [Methylobacterium sp. 2A]MWV24764.1 ImmA/IrrE family metallo-endopeptidase [Methylobacterium sp. 2A]